MGLSFLRWVGWRGDCIGPGILELAFIVLLRKRSFLFLFSLRQEVFHSFRRTLNSRHTWSAVLTSVEAL